MITTQSFKKWYTSIIVVFYTNHIRKIVNDRILFKIDEFFLRNVTKDIKGMGV